MAEKTKSNPKGAGRPATGIKRVSICISGSPEQIEELKSYAKKHDRNVSELILTTMGVIMNYSENEIIAMGKALEELGMDKSLESIKHYTDCGYLTINTGRDSKNYAWYFDGDCESCIEIESLNILNREEIEKNLEQY